MPPRSAVVVGVLLAAGVTACAGSAQTAAPAEAVPFYLPPVPVDASVILDQAFRERRSIREYGSQPLDLEIVARLMWAAQGRTQMDGPGRIAPSAGGTYPLEVYVATADGLLRYIPEGHRAQWITGDDLRPNLHRAALDQQSVRDAPAVMVITGVVSRTEERYGDRAERYVFLEAGHAAQNVLLQATGLGLGAVPVGAFRDDEVAKVLALGADEQPIYLIPLGYPPG
jgi:SagB-type dehydrogenase family enzyme